MSTNAIRALSIIDERLHVPIVNPDLRTHPSATCGLLRSRHLTRHFGATCMEAEGSLRFGCG